MEIFEYGGTQLKIDHFKLGVSLETPKHTKKSKPKLETSINLEAINIGELINLDDRIECIARTPAFRS